MSRSYKISFICAVFLHLALLIFLLVKFTSSSHHYVMNANVVQASIVNPNALNKRVAPTPPPPAPPKVEPVKPVIQPKPQQAPKLQEIIKPVPKENPDLTKQIEAKRKAKEALKQHLLAEQQKELANIKKQVKTTQQTVTTKNQQKQKELMQQTMEQQLAAERSQLAAARTSQLQGEIDKYKAMIIQAISSRWIIPDGVDNNATCQLLVSVAPGGAVLNVQIISSSGNALLDRSAQTAVLKASPLPVPETPELFDEFRSIKLKVRPEGIVAN